MIEFELDRSRLRAHEPLSGHSTMGVGGPAQYFFEIADAGELRRIVARCRDYEIPRVTLGNGSNTLFSDYGYEGAVLHLGRLFAGVTQEGTLLRVQSGKLLPALARLAAEEGLSGLEFACDIPASLGGGTAMNCGAFGGELAERVEYAEVLCGCGELRRLTPAECAFGYRDSVFLHSPECIVTEVGLRLVRSSRERVRARMSEIRALRRERQGVKEKSLGSVFLSADGVPAARLIDACGLKGFRIGGAAVSERHAGYVVNLGDATCENILALIAHIKSTVYRKYGIMLREEIRKI